MEMEHYGKILLGLFQLGALNEGPIKPRKGGEVINSLNKKLS